VSTVVEQPPAVPADPPAESTRRGSLLRAELHRFRSRRFIQLLFVLLIVGWVIATVIGLLNFGVPTDADRAAAQDQIDQIIAQDAEFQEQCQNDPTRPDDVPVELYCQPLNPDDLRVEDFVTKAPFDFEQAGMAGAVGFGAAAAVIGFLIGATWIGAEWSSRSIVALLFWVPSRMRVMAAKLGVLLLGAAVLGVLSQALWLAMSGILRATVGTDDALPDGFWGDLFATQGRTILLVVLTALGGFGLANLVRNTGASLGIGFVYFAIVETAIRALRPTWEPWLLTNNAAGLLSPGGFTVYVFDPQSFGEPEQYVITNLQGGLLLSGVVVVVVAIGVVLFAKRDLH
jgi:hypothetical protein